MKRNMNPKSLENLKKGKQYQFKSGEQAAKDRGKDGGVKSQKVQRSCREIAKLILQSDAPISDEQKKNLAKLLDLTEQDISINVLGTFAQAQKAAKGDLAALIYLRDTAGEKPTDHVEVVKSVSEAADEIEGILNEFSGDSAESH